MAFEINYSAGGVLDLVKKINLGPPLFPDPEKPYIYVKGFRIAVPAQSGDYTQTYVLPWDAEIISASVTCSGYYDGDFWELELYTPAAMLTSSPVGQKLIETCYTKELPESVSLDRTYPTITAGTIVNIDFNNISGTSKTVWINLKFLHG